MRHRDIMGLFGIASLLAGPSLASAAMAPSKIAGGTTKAANEPRYRFERAKRAQAKPRKRPNLRHVSKRVRRKHRRAA